MIGPETIQSVETEWPQLIAMVREELMSLFTGNDPEITKSAERYYQDHPDRAAQSGIDRELYLYINKVLSKF